MLLTAPLAVAALLAVCAPLGRGRARASEAPEARPPPGPGCRGWWLVPLLAALAVAGTCLLPPLAPRGIAWGVALAGLAAIAWPRRDRALASVLGLAGGVLAGLAAQGPWSTAREMAAVALAAWLLGAATGGLLRLLDRRWPELAMRGVQVAGAWVMVLGLLLALLPRR